MEKPELAVWELPNGCGRIVWEDVPAAGSVPGKARIAAIVIFASPAKPVDWSCKASSETTGQVQSPDGKVSLGADPKAQSIVVKVQAGASPGWYDKTSSALVPRVRG
jgi:hypothetical protein